MTPDKLPEEIIQNIDKNAVAADVKNQNKTWEYRAGYRAGHTDGATAWAPWKVKYDELKVRKADELAELQLRLLNIFEKHDELKKVLQEFISRHEAGLLPDRFVYDKAIKILNDGK